MRVSTYQTISTDEILAERYHIKKRLGSGNMGEVYQALDLEQGRMVAIKRIHPHLISDLDAIQRFQREAKALSRLNHPGIVRFHDFYVEDGAYFIIINYLDGQTLEEKLEAAKRKGKLLPLEETKTIVLQLCDALAYAHRRGIVHRDLKPANVMISPQGHAILMDFGIAKLLDGEQLTGDGLSPGTPGYMSPEMIRGRAIDGRADIYTVGIILYEMLTGQRPFQRSSRYDTMHSHLFDTAPDVRKFSPEVPHELAVLITQALAKEPEARFQTIDALGDALREVETTTGGEPLWHNRAAAAIPEPPPLPPLAFVEAKNSPSPRYPPTVTATEPALPNPPEQASSPIIRPLTRPAFSLVGTGFGLLLLCLLATAWGIWGLNDASHEGGVVGDEPVLTETSPLSAGETLPFLSPEPEDAEVHLQPIIQTKGGTTPTLAPTPTASTTRAILTAAASHTPTVLNTPNATATRPITLSPAPPTATRTPRPPAPTQSPIPTIQPTATAQPLPTATLKADSTPMPTPTPTPWIDVEPTKKKDAEDR